MEYANKTAIIHKNSDAFFDHTYFYSMSKSTIPHDSLKAIESLQKKAQSWNDLMANTVGKIAHHKCKWSLLLWDLSDTNAKI